MTDENKLLQTAVPLLRYLNSEALAKPERCGCYTCSAADAADEVIEQIIAYLKTKELKPYHILDTLEGKNND